MNCAVGTTGTVSTSVDTNILSAIVNQESNARLLAGLLGELTVDGPLVISAPVWVELAALPFSTPERVQSFLRQSNIRVEFDLPRPIWEAAATAYAQYVGRRRQSAGGLPRRLVTDFVIGAHALLTAGRLITMDARFFGESFPGLELVTIPGTTTLAAT